MASKLLSLSPPQWLAYFNQHHDVFNEMVDCALTYGEAGEDEEKQTAALEQGAEILGPKLDEIEQFQATLLKGASGFMLTHQEMVQELINIVHNRGTAEARGSGAATMKDVTALVREKLASKPDTEGMTPEEAAKATSDWEAQQRAELDAANRLTEAEGGDEKAAVKVAEEMAEKVTPATVNATIKLSNTILTSMAQNPPEATPKSSKSKSKSKSKAEPEHAVN